MKFQNCNLTFVTNAQTEGLTDKPIAICHSNLLKNRGIKIFSPNSCYQSHQMIIPSAISQETLTFKANYLLLEKKNMNSYESDILLLVQIPLALAFTSVHYFLNQLIDFNQTGIDTLLRGGEELIRFW